MSRVSELQPGDEVHNFGEYAVFVQRCQHPIWPSMQLVIWKMPDGTWSHDALDAWQEVGTPVESTVEDRMTRLRAALLGGTRDAST